MAAVISIICDRCSYLCRITDSGRQYWFTDRRTMSIRQGLAWCSACNEVVQAEHLPDVATIDRELDEIRTVDYGIETHIKEQMIRDGEQLKAWSLARTSPPKCLWCGSTSIILFAKAMAERWQLDYNHRRPHSSLGYRTPAEFAAECRQALSAAFHGPNDKPVLEELTTSILS